MASADWSDIWIRKRCEDRYSQSGYEKWLSFDSYQNKIEAVASLIRAKLTPDDRIVNIGAGVGYLEERFPEKVGDGSWAAYDISPQSCGFSNGLVKQKDIINIAAESANGNFLIMMGCSMYFRSGHVYEACAAFEKILIVDIALEEYPLSVATLDPAHYHYSTANFLQVIRITGGLIELSHFAMVPHRMTVYLENIRH